MLPHLPSLPLSLRLPPAPDVTLKVGTAGMRAEECHQHLRTPGPPLESACPMDVQSSHGPRLIVGTFLKIGFP